MNPRLNQYFYPNKSKPRPERFFNICESFSIRHSLKFQPESIRNLIRTQVSSVTTVSSVRINLESSRMTFNSFHSVAPTRMNLKPIRTHISILFNHRDHKGLKNQFLSISNGIEKKYIFSLIQSFLVNQPFWRKI